MGTDGLGILCDKDRWKWRFAHLASPKWMETEICRYCLIEMDRHGDSISITYGNGIPVSVRLPQAHFHFPFSMSPPKAMVALVSCTKFKLNPELPQSVTSSTGTCLLSSFW